MDAFQISSFHQRHGFPNYFYRKSLSRSSIIANGKLCAELDVDGVSRCRRSPYRRMRMASPMLQEDMNGDAPLTDDEPNRDTVESPSSSRATIPSDNKVLSVATKLKSSSRQRQRQPLPSNWLGEKNYILFTAVLIGLFTGINIAVFKTAVEFVREVLYGDGLNLQLISPYLWGGGDGGEEIRTLSLRLSEVLPISVIPAVGGLIVGLLLRFGGDMPPGLRDAVREGMNVSFSMTILEQSC